MLEINADQGSWDRPRAALRLSSWLQLKAFVLQHRTGDAAPEGRAKGSLLLLLLLLLLIQLLSMFQPL
jgi:hypothetical protein